jgi:hypothetical protein
MCAILSVILDPLSTAGAIRAPTIEHPRPASAPRSLPMPMPAALSRGR